MIYYKSDWRRGGILKANALYMVQDAELCGQISDLYFDQKSIFMIVHRYKSGS